MGQGYIVPIVIAGALTAGVAQFLLLQYQLIERIHLEKFLGFHKKKTLSDIGSEKATMSQSVVVTLRISPGTLVFVISKCNKDKRYTAEGFSIGRRMAVLLASWWRSFGCWFGRDTL